MQTFKKDSPEAGAYVKDFSEPGLQKGLTAARRRLGIAARKPLQLALTLHYTLQSPATPRWCKGVILGALGYFISLIDAIPDLTPLLGYTDDVGVMLAALATLGYHVTPAHREKAKQKLDEWIPPASET